MHFPSLPSSLATPLEILLTLCLRGVSGRIILHLHRWSSGVFLEFLTATISMNWTSWSKGRGQLSGLRRTSADLWTRRPALSMLLRLTLDAYDCGMEILNDIVLGCGSVELSHELVAFGLCRSEAFLAPRSQQHQQHSATFSSIQQHSATVQECSNCLIPERWNGQPNDKRLARPCKTWCEPIPTIAITCYNHDLHAFATPRTERTDWYPKDHEPLEDLEVEWSRTAACHDPPMKGTKSSLHLEWLSRLDNNLESHLGVVLGPFGHFCVVCFEHLGPAVSVGTASWYSPAPYYPLPAHQRWKPPDHVAWLLCQWL